MSYRRSYAYERIKPVIEELRTTRTLSEPEIFKSLVVFRKEAAPAPAAPA